MAADDDASEASGTRPRPARGRAKRRAEPGRAEQPRKKAKQAIYWKPRDETPMESPDMRLRGEPEPVDADGGDAPQGDDGDGSQGDAEDKRPCRELSNFVLYDQNYRMRDFETLRGEGKAGDWVPEMEGVFMPIFEGDGGDDFDDDEEEEEQSSTLETGSVASDDRENWYRVSSPDQVEYFFTQEGVSIWVLTPFSWLRLLRPHSLYEHCFKDVALASRIAWRVFMLAAFAPGTPFSDFIQNRLSFPFIMPRTARPDYNVFSGQVIIPREEQVYPVELTAADVDKYAGWIVETIRLEFLDSPESFPAIKALEEVVVFNELVSISGRKKPGAEAGLKDISRPERASIPQHIREHLKKNMTLATPLVHALSRGLFNVVRPLRYPDEEDVTLAPQMELILPGLPPVPSVDVDSIAWVGEATEKLGSRTFYTAADIATVQIGTHRIQRGSWILVQGSDGATGAHQTWCGRVLYLFEDREKRGVKRCAHVRYCDLMRDTLLAEFAAPRELAILHNCDDVDLDAFLGIPDVRFVPRRPLLPSFGDSEAVLERLKARALPEEAYLPWSAHEKNWTFFYRYLWDRDEGQYLDASVFEDDWDSEPHCRSCKTCARKEAEAPAVHCIRDKVGTITGCEIGERKIFVHDFVYYVSSDQRLGDPFEIGYVETFRGKAAKLQVEVRCFKRKDEWREREIEKSTNGDNPSNKWIEESLDPDEHPVLDERELYVTNIIELVPVSDVRGICRVVHASKLGKDELDAYKDASVDNFYYEKELFDDWRREPASALIWSTRRRELMIEDENERQEFENAFRPMKSLDLFAGAGGLSKGLELSGAIETAFAVENNAHAAETFRRNFENAVVIEEDVSLFLKEFWEMAVEGKNSGHVDLTPDELAKIEFLCGGPPCKGFSSLNPYRRPVSEI